MKNKVLLILFIHSSSILFPLFAIYFRPITSQNAIVYGRQPELYL